MGQHEISLSNYVHALSSGDPVPGGGAVAAVEAAMGAALLAMVANLTLGRKKFAEVHGAAQEILQEAELIRDRALSLATDDERAYRSVASALALPRDTDEEKTARRERVQQALKGAAQPPLQVMRTANQVVALAARLVEIGNPSAVSDVGVAVLSAQAAHAAARLNVEINEGRWCATPNGWQRSRKRYARHP